MMNAELVLTLAAIAIGTFLLRFSFVYLYSRLHLPKWLVRAMPYVPAAVLSALIFPALLIQDQQVFVSVQNQRLIAGIIAMLVSWYTKNLFATIFIGLGVFWFLVFI